MEFSYVVKIPKERVAVLIGQKGRTKKRLERLTKTKLEVDSKEGEVTLLGDDSLRIFQLKDVITAVGRGFNPETAQLLLKQDYVLEIINILDFVKDRKSHLARIRGRVIGTDGKTRSTIESLSETFLSIYGKTVAIIGTAERVHVAASAVTSLLGGAPHSHVYKRLEVAAQELKKKEMLG